MSRAVQGSVIGATYVQSVSGRGVTESVKIYVPIFICTFKYL